MSQHLNQTPQLPRTLAEQTISSAKPRSSSPDDGADFAVSSSVSFRLQLLQVARLAPRLLGDSTELVREFFRRQLSSEGAGLDRGGQPDLYYTIFALAGLQATLPEFQFTRGR
jgi:hypothetical protein